MPFKHIVFTVFFFSSILTAAHAAETVAEATLPQEEKATLATRATNSIHDALESGLGLIGIRYKRGGQSPETGFDCSGFVRHVFHESMGLVLPRSAKDISKTGDAVKKDELKPGDLVFFNTMRKTFSHVGIYLGGNLFLHSPRAGAKVRVEDMSDGYWVKRYNGARRIKAE